jgi:hypothetical protein
MSTKAEAITDLALAKAIRRVRSVARDLKSVGLSRLNLHFSRAGPACLDDAAAIRLVADLAERVAGSEVRMKYVLVPEEPTEAMIESALADHAENAPFDSPFGSRGSFASYYRAIISTLPPPAVSPATVTADDVLRAEMVSTLTAIGRTARSDGGRTFDDCIRDLAVIDDLARAVLDLIEGGLPERAQAKPGTQAAQTKQQVEQVDHRHQHDDHDDDVRERRGEREQPDRPDHQRED